MKKQLHYYALLPDTVSLFKAAEQQAPLRYTMTMNSTKPTLTVYLSGEDIASLGEAKYPSTGGSGRNYLITPREISANIEPFDGTGGERRYGISQRLNEDAVTIQLGGMWDGRIVISGRVATMSDTAIAKGLMKQFEKAFRLAFFTKVGHYLVGPEALEFLKQGGRLTIADQSPPEFDLKLV